VGPQQLPVGVTLNASLDIKSWIWTIAGTYSVMKSPEHSMELLLGARMVDMDQTLNYAFTGNIGSLLLPGPSGTKTLTLTNWDAIVGVKGQAFFGDDRKWFVPYYLDIGTGQSKFTWQGMLGVGYAFSKSASVVGAWRYLDYEMDSGDPIQSINFSGPLLGVVFSW
jgi:opacity protein-like surface antigen